MHLTTLKLKLASYGAIRPTVWTKILSNLKQIELKPDESFKREISVIVYVTNGLLKEYNVQDRKKPAIVNFICTGSFIITTKYSQLRYIKAISNTKLVYLDFDILISLFLKHNELKGIYDCIVASYDEGIAFRQLLLEENIAAARIMLFITRYRAILPSLRKKDISNYIHIDYDYFVRIYGKLL